MFSEHNVRLYNLFRKLKSMCVILCTDVPIYTDEDSRYIHLPKQLFIDLTNNTDINTMCFEITDCNDPLNKIFIKKIVPSEGEYDNYIWLPNWICNRLKIGIFDDIIEFVPIANPKKIKRIKIQGNISSYVNTDIKKLLELKIEQFKCINLRDKFNIENVTFEVKELVAENKSNPESNELVRFGIISNEVEIDFETPLDIQFLEKKKYIMDIITFEINKQIDEKTKQDLDSNLNSNSNSISDSKPNSKRKTGIFNFSDFMENEKKQTEQNSRNKKTERSKMSFGVKGVI